MVASFFVLLDCSLGEHGVEGGRECVVGFLEEGGECFEGYSVVGCEFVDDFLLEVHVFSFFSEVSCSGVKRASCWGWL